jgi:hypothetical protein
VRFTPEERPAPATHLPTGSYAICVEGIRTREERYRLVWETGLTPGLVLAELCRHCAPQADPLLELYGGCSRDAIGLVKEVHAGSPPRAARLRILGFTARGILYLLIAMAAFLLVTVVTSRGR